MKRRTQNDRMMTREQCAKWLGCSVRTLERDAAKPPWARTVPVVKLGRIARYHKQTILESKISRESPGNGADSSSPAFKSAPSRRGAIHGNG